MKEFMGEKWLKEARKVLDKIEQTQKDNILKAAEIMTETIANKHWVYVFGVGHAVLPVCEVYPRIGGIVGFRPILELPLSYFTHVVGDQGVRQFLFLERLEGYGKVIMKNYDFEKGDCMWIFSYSGINGVIIDAAMYVKEKGIPIIACTSMDNTLKSSSRHSSGKKLYELADVVIDCCGPAGDAMLEIEGLEYKIGPVSTFAFVAIVQCIVTQVIKNLVDRGERVYINPSVNIKETAKTADEVIEENLQEFARRLYRRG